MKVSAIAVVGISALIKDTFAFVPNLPLRATLLSRKINSKPINTKTTKSTTATIVLSSTKTSTSLLYKNETMSTDDKNKAPTGMPTNVEEPAATGSLADLCPFEKVMAANRGEIGERSFYPSLAKYC